MEKLTCAAFVVLAGTVLLSVGCDEVEIPETPDANNTVTVTVMQANSSEADHVLTINVQSFTRAVGGGSKNRTEIVTFVCPCYLMGSDGGPFEMAVMSSAVMKYEYGSLPFNMLSGSGYDIKILDHEETTIPQ